MVLLSPPEDRTERGPSAAHGCPCPRAGYMVARTLAAAPVIAESIVRQLQARGPAEGGSGEGAPSGWGPALTAEEVSAAVWQDIWPQWRKEQREFFCFGMDVLLRVSPAAGPSPPLIGWKLGSDKVVLVVCARSGASGRACPPMPRAQDPLIRTCAATRPVPDAAARPPRQQALL